MPQPLLLHEAVIHLLQQQGKDLTIEEITDQIKKQNLYVDENTGQYPTTTEVSRRISGATYKDEVFIRRNGLVSHKDIDDIRLLRLTWNTNGWQQPIAHKWSPKKQNTEAAFENQYGFGFEEWLFNPAFQIDSYQYGLIRGAEDIKNLHTIIREVFLFTINQATRERFLVGTIKNLELIASCSQAYSIVQPLFKTNRKMMADHLKPLKADPKGLDLATYPCVRFKLEDAQLYPKMRPLKNLPPKKFNRFIPYKVERSLDSLLQKTAKNNKFAFNEGEAKRPGHFDRTTNSATRTINRLHDQMLDDLKTYLQSQSTYHLLSIDKTWFGENKADVVAKHHDDTYSILEVKTSANVRRNIREALGQLLDYACWCDDVTINQLIIVSPEPLTDDALSYFKRLQLQLAIPVVFWYYDKLDRRFQYVA